MQQSNRYWIKAEAQRRGKNLTGLAIDAGREESFHRVALVRRNIRGEQAIAAYLGVLVQALLSDLYLTPRRKTIAERCLMANQKQAGTVDIGESHMTSALSNLTRFLKSGRCVSRRCREPWQRAACARVCLLAEVHVTCWAR